MWLVACEAVDRQLGGIRAVRACLPCQAGRDAKGPLAPAPYSGARMTQEGPGEKRQMEREETEAEKSAGMEEG